MTRDKAPGDPTMLAYVEYRAPAPGLSPGTVYAASVGVRPPSGGDRENDIGGSGHTTITATLQLTSTDTEIDIRVFFDGHFAELFFMGGRVALTVAIPASTRAGKSQSCMVNLSHACKSQSCMVNTRRVHRLRWRRLGSSSGGGESASLAYGIHLDFKAAGAGALKSPTSDGCLYVPAYLWCVCGISSQVLHTLLVL